MDSSFSAIAPRRIVVAVVSLVLIVTVSANGMLAHPTHAAHRNHAIGMVDHVNTKLPGDAAHRAPVCDERSLATTCNDLWHFMAIGVSVSRSSTYQINTAKCNDMRHFGSFADQSYAEVCQP